MLRRLGSTAFCVRCSLTIVRTPAACIAQGEESVGCRDHRCGPLVDGVDDLGVVDSAQIRRDDPKVCVPELALDDNEGNAFARHLDGVRVTELMWGEPPSDAGLNSNPA